MLHSLFLVGGLLGAWTILKAVRPLSEHPRRGIRMASSFMLLSLLPASALTVAITTFLMLIADGDCFARSATWDQVTSLVLSIGVMAYFGVSLTRGIERRMSLARIVRGLPVSNHPAMIEALARQEGERPVIKTLPLDRPVAFVSGWRRPVVAISAWMLTNLDPVELEAVIAHELAHVRRKDAVLAALGALWAQFVPLADLRRIQAGLMADIEDAADALAVAQTGEPLALASALAKLWRFGTGSDLRLAGAAQFGDSETIHRRILQLMAEPGALAVAASRRDLRRSLVAIGLAWGIVILALGVGPSWAMAQDHRLHCQIEIPS